MTARRSRRALLVLLVASVLLGACGSDDGTAVAKRQAQVHEVGSHVMPFLLDATKHSFVKRSDGGVQTVVVQDPRDSAQVSMVRMHIQMIRDEFARGNFSDPMEIHGSDMPGVKALAAGASRLTITYADVPAGGRITYRTEDRALVRAIHDWFDAQLADHGKDATATPLS